MEVCGLWRELEIVTVGHVSPVVCVQPVCAGEDGAEREGLLTQDNEGLAGLAQLPAWPLQDALDGDGRGSVGVSRDACRLSRSVRGCGKRDILGTRGTNDASD